MAVGLAVSSCQRVGKIAASKVALIRQERVPARKYRAHHIQQAEPILLLYCIYRTVATVFGVSLYLYGLFSFWLPKFKDLLEASRRPLVG